MSSLTLIATNRESLAERTAASTNEVINRTDSRSGAFRSIRSCFKLPLMMTKLCALVLAAPLFGVMFALMRIAHWLNDSLSPSALPRSNAMFESDYDIERLPDQFMQMTQDQRETLKAWLREVDAMESF